MTGRTVLPPRPWPGRLHREPEGRLGGSGADGWKTGAPEGGQPAARGRRQGPRARCPRRTFPQGRAVFARRKRHPCRLCTGAVNVDSPTLCCALLYAPRWVRARALATGDTYGALAAPYTARQPVSWVPWISSPPRTLPWISSPPLADKARPVGAPWPRLQCGLSNAGLRAFTCFPLGRPRHSLCHGFPGEVPPLAPFLG